ncbi:hypothetical protein HAX54_010186 [Datura stramonium]|uniref:Uncharacterized protein n=1 Tax=Datura stramonium TaxID=4076 RepID=A0ABS8THT9_DATST|nr:hypothetical protein [Datura stramonium]
MKRYGAAGAIRFLMLLRVVVPRSIARVMPLELLNGIIQGNPFSHYSPVAFVCPVSIKNLDSIDVLMKVWGHNSLQPFLIPSIPIEKILDLSITHIEIAIDIEGQWANNGPVIPPEKELSTINLLDHM